MTEKESQKLSIHSRASGGGLVVDFDGQLLQIRDEKLAHLIVRAVNSLPVAEKAMDTILLFSDPCHFCPRKNGEHSQDCLTNLARKFQEMKGVNREQD